MKLRKIIFWLHLMAGVVAGTVILVMSVTGVLLAFERQIVAFAEREARTAKPPGSGAPRLGLEAMVAKAHEAVPEGTLSGATLSADPTMAAVISMGREQTILVDPYTGSVRPGATALRRFFHTKSGSIDGVTLSTAKGSWFRTPRCFAPISMTDDK